VYFPDPFFPFLPFFLSLSLSQTGKAEEVRLGDGWFFSMEKRAETLLYNPEEWNAS